MYRLISASFASQGALSARITHPVTGLPQLASLCLSSNNYGYFYPPGDPDDYRTDMADDHNVVVDIDSDRIVKFLKRGKTSGPDNKFSLGGFVNEVLRPGTTTSFFNHLVRLFTSSIRYQDINNRTKSPWTKTPLQKTPGQKPPEKTYEHKIYFT